MKIEINNRKMTGKSPNIWQLNNTLLNNPKRNSQGKLENILNGMKWRYKIYGIQQLKQHWAGNLEH